MWIFYKESFLLFCFTVKTCVGFIQIINFIFRNKVLISSITVSLFIFSCIYSLTKKRVWEGQFEIVLRQNDDLNPAQLFLSQNSKLLDALDEDIRGKSKSKNQFVAKMPRKLMVYLIVAETLSAILTDSFVM